MHYIWALFLILVQKQQRDISDIVCSGGFSFGENDLRIKLTQNLKNTDMFISKYYGQQNVIVICNI